MAFVDVINLLPALPLLLPILLSSFSNAAPGMKVNLAKISIIFASGFFFLFPAASLLVVPLSGAVALGRFSARTQAGSDLETGSKLVLFPNSQMGLGAGTQVPSSKDSNTL